MDKKNIFRNHYVIAGPCSAESESQVMETARELAKNRSVKVFRAGIWKPRTMPGGFEGVGNIGLEWLKSVRDETGLPICTEVANVNHIDKVLKAEIDMIWIGARTAVNPFLVQELAEALRGVDIPVMIKNPINPDLKLWIGAIERFMQSGVKDIAAVHRGFYYFDQKRFRNSPMWEIPIALKRMMPEIPIIVDPSHICGSRKYLSFISQKAYDLEMDGLMIESHINPDEALTDKEQQLTPGDLYKMINSLVLRDELVEPSEQLEKLRSEIDKLDAAMLELVSQRMELIEKIGEIKKDESMTILQIDRWNSIFSERLENGVNIGLDKDFLKTLLQLVHKESIRVQTDILNRKK